MNFSFVPASSLTLAQLADLYTRTFADYFYEAIITPELMAHFVCIDHLDLHRSPVLRVGDELVGLATVGVRGDETNCKGFGIVVPYRGRGLAHHLCIEVLNQARLAGARRLTLGVLQKNERAVKTYLRAGLRIRRELFSFEWNSTSPPAPLLQGEGGRSLSASCATAHSAVGAQSRAAQGVGEGWSRELQAISPQFALQHFAALHRVPPIWERDLPTLQMLDDLKGLALANGDTPCAYVLFQQTSDDTIEIVDIASVGAKHASPLLCALQPQYSHITCGNEPADSPMVAVFREAGFTETWRRYEMEIEL